MTDFSLFHNIGDTAVILFFTSTLCIGLYAVFLRLLEFYRGRPLNNKDLREGFCMIYIAGIFLCMLTPIGYHINWFVIFGTIIVFTITENVIIYQAEKRNERWVIDYHTNFYLVSGVEKRLKKSILLSFNYMEKGVEEYNAGNYENSLYYFIPAILLNPDDPQTYGYVGTTKTRLKEYSDAFFYFDSAIEKFPNDSNLYAERSWAYLRIEHIQTAMDDINTAIMLNGNVAKYYYFRACIYNYKEEYEKAIVDFTKALSLVDWDYLKERIYLDMAYAYLNLLCFQNVDKCIEEIIKMNPKRNKAEIMNEITGLKPMELCT